MQPVCARAAIPLLLQISFLSVAAVGAPPVYDIPRMDKIVIDGKAGDWGDGGFRVDVLPPLEGRPKAAADHDARVRLAWNRRGLLVRVRVRDDQWVEHKDEGWLWRYDGIEVFLAPEPRAKEMCQWVVSPGVTPEQKALRWHLHDYRKDPAVKKLPAAVRAARTRTPDGYLCEMLLPWTALDISPKSGREVGFQIIVNDADKAGGQTDRVAWFPSTNTGHDSKNMHRLRLAGKPAPSVSLATWSRYDWSTKRRRIDVVAPAALWGKELIVRRRGKPVFRGRLAKGPGGRATAELLVPERPCSALVEDYSVHLAGAAASTPGLEGQRDFQDYPSVTDLSQRPMLASMYVGHDETNRLYVGAIEAALREAAEKKGDGDVLAFLRHCAARKARALWPYRVSLEPSPTGLSVRVDRWLSSWTGSTGYDEAPLLDRAEPVSGQIVLDVVEHGGPRTRTVIAGKVLEFQCVRGKTAVNPRWYQRASVDLTAILRPKVAEGRFYRLWVLVRLADGRQIGRAKMTVGPQLKPVEALPVPTYPPLPTGPKPKPLRLIVELEQDVYSYQWANNGATPMWCHNNTSIVRIGDKVFASGIETLPKVAPPWNTRWMLFAGGKRGLRKVVDGGDGREREPCPMACFPADSSVLLSVNPAETEPGNTPDVQVLRFPARMSPADAAKPKVLIPRWAKPYKASAHTYRTIAADGPNREMVLFYLDYRTLDGWKETLWSFYSKGRWVAKGVLTFPSVRVTYPAVQLRDRAVYQFGSTDPVPGGSPRDYQQLYYTWCDDITTGKFHPWVEIVNRERTGGYVWATDLYVSRDRRDPRVHVLWYDRFLKAGKDSAAFREKFTPGEKQRIALNYSVIRRGKVLSTTAIVEGGDDGKGEIPGRTAKFHATPDGRLFVLHCVQTPTPESRLIEIFADGSLGKPVKIPLKRSIPTFFTAGVRAGCEPSWTIDLFGDTRKDWGGGGTMRYARIRLTPPGPGGSND